MGMMELRDAGYDLMVGKAETRVRLLNYCKKLNIWRAVGILSLANRLGLGAGICTGNILEPNGDKTFYVFHIYSTENVFRKNHRNI
jgi:hypothetical protein